MAKILVTGGAGFIGSHVCEHLLKRGDEVICIDAFNEYYAPKFKHENIEDFAKNKNFHLYARDINDNLADIFQKHMPEKIIHLAASVGVRASLDNPQLYEHVNVKGTINVLDFAKEHNVKNFIFASSSSVYGNSTRMPFSETDENTNPLSPYAATKLAGELICREYNRLYDLRTTCLRFFTVYGPRGRPDMAPYKFTEKLLQNKHIERYGNGDSKRDYTFISDIVSGILASLDKNLSFEIINLGNDAPVKLDDFINIIAAITGKKAIINNLPSQSGDAPITHADISKAKNLLDYEPKVKIEQGMKQFVEWYLAKRNKL